MQVIWNFFLRKYKFTFLVIAALIAGGLYAVYALPKEANPEVKVPIGVVTTIYPGASAADVERLITDELEEEILTLEELDEVTSSSQESLSSITVNFNASADIDDRIRALKDAISDVESELPSEVDSPNVLEINLSDIPIVVMSIKGDVEESELKRIAEEMQTEIEAISGVSEARITGARDQEVQITVDKRKLDQFDLGIGDVVSAIQASNISSPVGSIETDSIRYNIRVDAEISQPEVIENIPVKTTDLIPIYIRDIATVDFGFAKRETISRLSIAGEASSNAVAISVFKKTGGDIITISGEAKAKVQELIDTRYPELEFFVSTDNADQIRKDLGNLLSNGITTIIIVGLFLFLFLGWREAIIASISIPLTFFFGFIGMTLLGSSINFLSLFSLILALGILVDTGIVIVEGLHAYSKQGYTPFEAAKSTVEEFQWPLIAGTLTTVSAFLPMLFMSGIMGEYVKHIPITVSLVLVGSLFVALALLPLIGSFLIKSEGEKREDLNDEEKVSRFLVGLQKWYKTTITDLLNNSRKQILFAGVVITSFIVALSLPVVGFLQIIMFPANDADFFYIDVEAPIGTTLEVTDRVVQIIEEELYQDPLVESFVANIGTGNGSSGSATGGTPTHLASITVNIMEERDEKTTDILAKYRKLLSPITEAKITVKQEDSGPPTGAPVLITFKGPDLLELERLGNESVRILEQIPGTADIDTSYKEAALEFVMNINQERAASYGLSPLSIAQTLRSSVQGNDASKIRYNGDDIDVNVLLSLNPQAQSVDDRTQTTINEIEQIVMTAPNGQEVSLSNLVDIIPTAGTTAINHTDGDRRVNVSAYNQGRTPTDIFADFEQRIDQLEMEAGYTIKLGGEAEDVEQSFRDLFAALFIGLFLIAAILLLQFDSFRQPMFILSSLPLALIGVLPGLAILNIPLSFPAFIGIVALSGVVVNDAIILIDNINENRRNGMDKKQAVITGGINRMQPILLTTITTVVGILPLSLSDPIWGGLGFSMVFGLMFATVLTLFVIPMMYNRFGEKELPVKH